MSWFNELFIKLSGILPSNASSLYVYYTLFIRFVLPLLAIIILVRTLRSLTGDKYDYEEWGYLSLPNGSRMTLNHWENVIGRAKASDVFMEYPTLSRSHAALIRDDKGAWRIHDLGSKSGIKHNGKKVQESALVKHGDILVLGGIELVFITKAHVKESAEQKKLKNHQNVKHVKPFGTMVFLTEFQVALGLQLCISMDKALPLTVPLSFAALIAVSWFCYILTKSLRRVAFEVETIALLLSTIGFAVTATSAPDALIKQLVIFICGICLYFLLGWFLRDLDRAVKLRWPIAIAGLVLLAVNLLLGQATLGEKNWLSIGGMSFQPSEFVKLAFVFAGAATLDRLFAKRNLLFFIIYSGICVLSLALIGDFGAALIFFITYLTISFIRSGDLATVFLSVGGSVFAGFMAVTLKPHVAARFSAWGHVWEQVNDAGFQQTRTMMAAASGGLFGVGAGNGWFKKIFAADTDMVFGIVCEELGLIIGLAAIIGLLIFVYYTIRASKTARSSLYIIGACAASAVMVFQMILNVFGSVDILPFTGVTFPFVSKGGSSLIVCWGLLAFIKAVDTRKNASFVVKTEKNIQKKETKRQLKTRRPTERYTPDGYKGDGNRIKRQTMFQDDDLDFSDIFERDDY